MEVIADLAIAQEIEIPAKAIPQVARALADAGLLADERTRGQVDALAALVEEMLDYGHWPYAQTEGYRNRLTAIRATGSRRSSRTAS